MQKLKWTTDEKQLLTEEVLGVIAQHAGVQRCVLQASTQLDMDLSFVLIIGEPNNCHPHPTGPSPHSTIMSLIDYPLMYESPHFSTVTIRLLSLSSASGTVSHVGLITACSAVLFCAILIFAACWCKHRARALQVRDSYHSQP
ncbi:hypothetical protein GDO81_001777 [Engystomops pustulosus]|uniref:Uncharacterized protein n=1 Tax=Engystomops pustulosus TaxID=76066 RepID=A0AAV7DFF1_ENGPU|nr:hypothetical protein GDO81_001777 [Engystomops pustulosus]